MAVGHSTLREGVFAGFIGATVIAAWFFIIDAINGQLLFTPDLLGAGLLGIFGVPSAMDTTFMHVALYTVFHYAAFSLVGILVAVVIHQAERTPGILAGFLVGFVVVMMGFYMLSALLSESPLGRLAWWQVLVGNFFAAAAMGWYMWKRHPKLGGEFRDALEGTDERSGLNDGQARVR
jgi:hypothetical protein